MSRKVFTAGEVLAAADVNSFLMDQTVMSFAGTASRGSAIPSPVEGMATFLEDSNHLSIYDGSDWKNSLRATGGILQVVSTAKTDTFITSSSTFADITGLSATITPTSTSSKIYISVSTVSSQNRSATATNFLLLRDSTSISVGDAAGSRTRASAGSYGSDNNEPVSVAISFFDSPNTTSAVTYKVQMRSTVNGNASFINQSWVDTDAASNIRTASVITLMEVAG